MSFSTSTLRTLAKFRPPFTRSSRLKYPWNVEGKVNAGVTFSLPFGESVTAACGGKVAEIVRGTPDFYTQDATLVRASVNKVVLDHGNGVTSLVNGLEVVNVLLGQDVQRGDILGTTKTSELFFAVMVANKAFNPITINAHFNLQNGDEVVGQTDYVRFAPDKYVRDLSQGIVALYNSGIRYFSNSAKARLLVNIDFNGDGTKSGPAVAGFSSGDVWNVYTPQVFTASINNACYIGFNSYSFTAPQGMGLLNYDGKTSPIMLERVAPMSGVGGTTTAFDPMLSTYMGSSTSDENQFNLRNVPPGTYRLYLYCSVSSGPTIFVSLDGNIVDVVEMTGQTVTTFIQATNYNLVNFTVTSRNQVLNVSVTGRIAGLQLLRT